MTDVNPRAANICFKYRDKVLAFPSPDGPDIPLYADDLLDPRGLHDYLWDAYESGGGGSMPSGWKFIIELYGKEKLINFYLERGRSREDAEKIIDHDLSHHTVEADYDRRKTELLAKLRESSLAFYNDTPSKIIISKDLLCYNVFKPLLLAYFQDKATLTKAGYSFFETLHYSIYLSGYYWYALHKKLQRFKSREDAEQWIHEQKQNAPE